MDIKTSCKKKGQSAQTVSQENINIGCITRATRPVQAGAAYRCRGHTRLPRFLMGFMLLFITSFHVFSPVLLCPLRFRRKSDVRFVLIPVSVAWNSCFIHDSCSLCPKRYPYEMMFVSFKQQHDGCKQWNKNCLSFPGTLQWGSLLLNLQFSVYCFYQPLFVILFFHLSVIVSSFPS